MKSVELQENLCKPRYVLKEGRSSYKCDFIAVSRLQLQISAQQTLGDAHGLEGGCVGMRVTAEALAARRSAAVGSLQRFMI